MAYNLPDCGNLNLERAVETGTFLVDFSYRVNVLSVTVPALRERWEKIPVLIAYVLRKYSEE